MADLAALSRPGPFLDVFSGMCSVAREVSRDRQIWTNDIQYFAHEVAKAHFCGFESSPTRSDAVFYTRRIYSDHVNVHTRSARTQIQAEENFLRSENYNGLNNLYDEWSGISEYVSEHGRIFEEKTLFKDAFAGSYFSMMQSIEIDSLRHALDLCLDRQQITDGTYRWLILALGVALSKCTTTTGHFAQPLAPKASNIKKFVAQRRRSIWDNWAQAIESLSAVHDSAWRQSNRAFRQDAVDCVTSMSEFEGEKPTIVYADPPYTRDQYSRYYHIYETLILYDYPAIIGKGRYRTDRFVSNFSRATTVLSSLDKLVEMCSKAGADLIISYPTNGLLVNSREVIPEIIARKYGKLPQISEIPSEHSTMGGSKGNVKQSVTEVLYRAYH